MKQTLLSLFLILSLSAVWAQSGKWTPEDIVNAESANSFDFSSDGKMVVWTKRTPLKDKDRFINKIFLTRLDVKEEGKYLTVQLTQGDDSDYSPLFGKDNKTIYFLSSLEKGKKLWSMSIYGGEPSALSTFENGISRINWLNDSTLAFVASEGKTLYETELEERKDDVEVIEDSIHFKPTRLFAFHMKTKEIKRLSDNRFPIGEYAVSKDGNWLISSHIRSPHFGVDGKPKPEYILWNLKTGTKTNLFTTGFQSPNSFRFTQDNSGFYFEAIKSSNPEWEGAGINLLYFYQLNTQKISEVPLQWEWGIGGGTQIVGNHLLVALANGATNKLALYEKRGETWAKMDVDAPNMNEHIGIFSFSKDYQQLIYAYSTASTPIQYHLGKLKLTPNKKAYVITSETELIKLNENFKSKTKAKSEVIKWKGYQNEEVTGILYYPHNYKSGRAYPLVVAIHGGPSAADFDEWGESWAYYPNILAQKGAFVLMPNYHGSSNHGLKFVESIKKNYYEPELEDITKGIDFLATKGMVNKDSMGVMGWSNGAILTTMLTVRFPDMFKVAGAGAGDVNWTSDYGNCEFGVTFDQTYFGGAPWDNLNGKTYNETYILKSPLFEMERVKTPTIIFHGSEDRAVPRDQGWEYYRALQQIGKAPVRFLWFPGQPHGLQKITHQLRKIKEESAWFDKYLFGTYKPENEAFKKESPLAVLLEKDKIAQSNGLFGLIQNGVLIPETVALKKDSIQIGRFEVTNAQFKAYKNTHTYLESEANFPVKGISAEEAQAYTQWLSQKTGTKYRLPNTQEAKVLQEKAKSTAANENTLKYWAGYNLTLDEVPMFLEKIKEAKTSLVKQVGSFKPAKVNEAELYDLGGNVAEFYITSDNKFAFYGYGAYDFADSNAEDLKKSNGTMGFRVVREK
jgi:dipeptidyl aminopeptidase/acylaminoacyl peptidase